MNYSQGKENDVNRIGSMRETGREGEPLRRRVERARHIVDDVRERAEVAFRDRPLLVPVAAGAVGLGIGVLLGSKLTRLLLFTAVGTLLSDTLGGEIKRVSREFLDDMQHRLNESEGSREHVG